MNKQKLISEIKLTGKHLNTCYSTKNLNTLSKEELSYILERNLNELRISCVEQVDLVEINLLPVKQEQNLTEKEFIMLCDITNWYTFDDNVCFLLSNFKKTNVDKGVLGSLVKKGLIFDSFKDTDLATEGANFFPENKILDLCNLKHY